MGHFEGCGFRPEVFFSNSNIVPYEEYAKRRDELAGYAASFGLEVIDDEYDHSSWLEYVRSRFGAAVSGPERDVHRGRVSPDRTIGLVGAKMEEGWTARVQELPREVPRPVQSDLVRLRFQLTQIIVSYLPVYCPMKKIAPELTSVMA